MWTVNIRICTDKCRHCLVQSVLQGINEQQKCMLHTLGQYILSFVTQPSNIYIATEEVQQLR